MTHRPIATVAPLILLVASGCLVYSSDRRPSPPAEDNVAASVDWADASCYWDDRSNDDIWWFEADISDNNGLDDMAGVYADVYDATSGEWVDAFELYYDGGQTWTSSWQGRSTYLDCDYYNYIVDFVAEDTVGAGTPYSLVVY